MKRYLATAVVHALAVALGVSMLSFVFMRMSGDPVMLMLPPDATHQQIEDFRERMGFNDSLAAQYVRFLGGAVKGDFGQSLRHQQPSMGLVLERLPATMELAAAGMVLALLVAIPVGIASARGAGQGAVGAAGRVAARATEHADPARHGGGPPDRRAAERDGGDRDRVRVARRRPARRAGGVPAGLPARAGRGVRPGDDLRRRELPRRCDLPVPRPADPPFFLTPRRRGWLHAATAPACRRRSRPRGPDVPITRARPPGREPSGSCSRTAGRSPAVSSSCL